MNNSNQAFISYSRKDKAHVDQFVSGLEALGLTTWIDQNDISLGDGIVQRIENGIEKSEYFILFASANYFKGRWTKLEYQAAMYLAASSDKIKIIAIRLADIDLPVFLASKLYLDWDTADSTAEKVFNWIESKKHYNGSKDTNSEVDFHSDNISFWNEIQDVNFNTILSYIIFNFDQLILETTSAIPVEFDFNSNEKTIIEFQALFLRNELLMADIRSDAEIVGIKKRIVAEFKKDLSVGGLGIISPAYKIILERELEELAKVEQRLRSQMSILAPKIIIRDIVQ